MSIIAIIWAVLIALKIAGLAHFGWAILILWPLIPALIVFALVSLGAVGIAAFNWKKL
jgi:hypothetical protein